LRIEVDYRSEVSRTKSKKVSTFFFHSYALKKTPSFRINSDCPILTNTLFRRE
jgi:hypothetical protein